MRRVRRRMHIPGDSSNVPFHRVIIPFYMRKCICLSILGSLHLTAAGDAAVSTVLMIIHLYIVSVNTFHIKYESVL